MVTYSPTDEWLNPHLWEFWAMLLTTAILAAVGYWAALQEDQDRQRYRKRRHSQPVQRRKHTSSQQRSVSYRAQTWQPSSPSQPSRALPKDSTAKTSRPEGVTSRGRVSPARPARRSKTSAHESPKVRPSKRRSASRENLG